MPRLACIIFALTAACSRVPNVFEVTDRTGQRVSAVLEICSSETSLQKIGSRFWGIKTIDCEGGGVIKMLYPDGKMVECPIGYVTPGAYQHFSYLVDDWGCGTFLK